MTEALLESVSPRDGTRHGEVPATPPGAVPAAVARCRTAQQAWAARPLKQRVEVLRACREAFLAQAEALVKVLTEETGRPEGESWLSEVVPDGDLFSFWLARGPGYLKRERVKLGPLNFPGKTAFIEKVPRGVLGLVTPWNLPVAIPLRTIVPALLAGNGVVWKPSEHTPRTAQVLAKILAEHLPEHLLTVVQGTGEVGDAVVRSGVDQVVFTGSVKTGRKVAAAAAERLIPASLELGGKDAALVLADADLDRAAEGVVWGAMFNAGQNCAAIERVYVEKPVAEVFRQKVRERAMALRLGEDVGPLTTGFQLDTVVRQVEAAKAAGARVECGGERAEGPGRFYEPTVLTGVPAGSPVLTEETFGPVLPLVEVEGAEAGLAAMNDSEFGLTASIWTRDVWKGFALARRVEAGVVTVNDHGFTGGVPALPWTGTKSSGFGVTNSHFALESMVRPRTVLLDRSRARRELWWYPYNPVLLRIARALVDLARGKLGALGRLVSSLPKRFKGS